MNALGRATAFDEAGPLFGSDPVRQLPHNFEAERALLGAVLMNNKAFNAVSDFLEGAHFADPLNGKIFDTCRGLIDTNQQANPVTLKSYLDSDQQMAAAGGMTYIASLAAGAVTVVNAGEYGRIIYDLYQRREIIRIAEETRERAFASDLEVTAGSLIESTESALQDLANNEPQNWASDISDEYDDAVKRWEAHDKGEISGLSSGLADVDDICGLRQAGDLEIYGARPGMCKTTLAQKDAYFTAQHFRAKAEREGSKPQWVVFFSLEMTRAQLVVRVHDAPIRARHS